MCGIIGYIQNNNPNITKDILCDLQKLEYRGYDSAGICVISNGEFVTTKSLGEIKNLKQKTSPICATCGIAHTRWATHGNVSLQNTHPHFDNKKEWSVVHNGIIENHIVLKNKLKKNSATFYG
ncbi:MAG: class II glutamine amidotransferase [Clostridia bacterium]|nr:class II glutamine amidotransferase [Clostridia bacterium]